jgi:hypothetical protein
MRALLKCEDAITFLSTLLEAIIGNEITFNELSIRYVL